ncbi:MAG: hypothetical protein MUD10_03920, partial [Candidatus Pacebacteria bacterium]|nr:hypothetical protein [Candidatus Paceibacterota bacterium]
APLVTVYDAVRNKSAENVSMTRISAGIYEYTFAVANSAVQGTWETQVDVQIEAGKIVQANDYWNVAGSPAQIIINSVTDLTIPEVSANITLTNEGTTGYEYTYEWCVVSSQDNACGGSDDVFYSSAAKFVQPAEDWITNLNATVPNTGNYWFKVIVHFGTQQSGASQSFTAINQSGGGNGGGGGGGGSGGGTTLIQNISKALTSAGQAICNQNTFPCNIILQILARLDAGDKKTASIENKIVEIDRKLAAMLSAPITKAAPQRIYVQPAPKKTTVNKKAKFFVE